ncbi:MAG: PD-(D/E)XK nuclease family protein, partial [Fimbriimonadales bacterium]|nr:PD-(D/E)XK nuclease family protein [Fimbriimonadales bacterium]
AGADHEVYDWHGYLRALTGVTLITQPTPEMVALLGEVCEQTLSPQSYFGKVRGSIRFHNALAQSFCRWSMDGLTPELLEQGSATTARLYAHLAELDDDALLEEWETKTTELALLWQAWQNALQHSGQPEPIRVRQSLLNALQYLPDAPPFLLAGLTELTVVELEALRILEDKTQVALALLYDAAYPQRYAPTDRIRRLLSQWGVRIEEVQLSEQEFSVMPGSPESHPATPAPATILDTPNPLYEVETVAREILRLHHEGVPFSEMAVLLRQPESLIETLEVIFKRYEIPLQGEVGLPLERSWRVRWLMKGVCLLLNVGSGEDWLHWLEHPQLELDATALRRLRRALRRHMPAALWLERAQGHASEPELQRLLSELNTLRQTLPADLPQVARRLILKLLGSTTTERDADLSEWLRLIDAYGRAWRRYSAQQSVALLERLVSGARAPRKLGSDGVRLLPMEYADFVGARTVFVLQVLEGTLPRRHPDDPFLREVERTALNQALQSEGVYLPTRADYQAGEPMLFQRVLQTPQERLYLSYSRTQGGDSDALPSFYLEELKAECGDAVQTRFYSLEQITPAPEACLHPYDHTLSQPIEYIEPALSVRRSELRNHIAQTGRRFSVTELETLVRCPFEHFARYLLRLRPAQRELSVRDVGSLTHAALCRAVRHPPQSHQARDWIDTLTHQLQAVLSGGAPDLPDWQVQVLHALAQRLLRRFGLREPLYQQHFDLQPFACEWAFGGTDADDEERTLTEPLHNQQEPRAIAYRLNNGQEIRLCGIIDRIDLSANRDVALVMDYKLGNAPSKRDFVEGRAIQGLLYLHAVKTVLPDAQVVLAYDQLKSARRVRLVPNQTPLVQRFRRMEHEEPGDCQTVGLAQWRQAEQRLRESLTRAMGLLSAAHIEPTPGDHCRRCAFGDLCRRAQR